MPLHAEHFTVAVIGTGTMGMGIAQVAAQAGHPVRIYDLSADACQHALAKLKDKLEKLIDKGRMSPAQVSQILTNLHPVNSLEQLDQTDLVIEAIVEDLAAKQSLFRQLELFCPPHCLFASNTSSLSITAIASVLNNPRRLVGMHFFNPAPLMRLVEIVVGLNSDNAVIDKVKKLTQLWGKYPVICRSNPGFIVNRVARPFYAEAWRALEEQVADAAILDAVMVESGGFPMGPLALTDLIGQDINYAVTQSVYNSCFQDPRYLPCLLQKELVDAGRLGKKSGQGVYHYDICDYLPVVEPLLPIEDGLPLQVRFSGNWQNLTGFTELLTSKGYLHSEPTAPPQLWVNNVHIALTKGVTASELSSQTRQPIVLFDLSDDYQQRPGIALSAAQQNTPEQTAAAIVFFQLLGKRVFLLQDHPGLLVCRTLALLCNEALELVHKGIASAEEIDFAMQHGVNYPHGPISWGGKLGWQYLLQIIEQLHNYYGEARYRASPLLRQQACLAKDSATRSG